MRRAVFTAALLAATTVPVNAQESESVVRFPIRGTVPEDFDVRMQRVIIDAQSRGAEALFLDIDAWQGRLGVVQTALGWIQDAEIPVYAFISGIAHESGALIALAADSIFMTPNSSIGGHVHGMLELDPELKNETDDLQREFRRLAATRRIDPAIMEAMANASLTVPGLVDSSTLLTLTAQAAVDLRLASGIVSDLQAAIDRLALGHTAVISANERGFTGATIEIQNNSWRDARVYVVRGTNRKRLGLITSMGTREYILQPAEIAVGAEVRLVADPVGGAQDHVSQTIRMVPGIVIQWNLQNNPAQSSIFIFHP